MRTKPQKSGSRGRRGVFAVSCLVLMCGCTNTIAIRLENSSTLDFTEVSVAGQPYDDLAPGAISEYKEVKTRFRYAVLRLTADGHAVNAQTLYLGARRFTHQVAIKDLAAGHLTGKLVRE